MNKANEINAIIKKNIIYANDTSISWVKCFHFFVIARHYELMFYRVNRYSFLFFLSEMQDKQL